MNPYEPPDPDVERGLAERGAPANPARVLLYIVGGICVFRGLSLVFNVTYELTLLAFGGTAIWLARQHFDTTVRLTTIGWSVSAILLVLAVIAIDPPSSKRDVAGAGVAGVALIIAVAIATIAFRRQPIEKPEQPPTSSDIPNSLGDSSNTSDMRLQLVSIFARWSISLSLITILSCVVGGVAFFFLIVVPVGHFFDVQVARLAFQLPFLVAPCVWIYGMIRCHRKHPSKGLMISLGVTGVALYALLPVILYAMVMSSSGGLNVK